MWSIPLDDRPFAPDAGETLHILLTCDRRINYTLPTILKRAIGQNCLFSRFSYIGDVYSLKLNNTKREQMREMYRSGQWTRPELATIFCISLRSVNYILKDVKKPFKYDAMSIATSLDSLVEKGREPGTLETDPLTILTKEPEYVKIVKCPEKGCSFQTTANKLLVHLVRKHQRHDLEYLL